MQASETRRLQVGVYIRSLTTQHRGKKTCNLHEELENGWGAVNVASRGKSLKKTKRNVHHP